MPEICGHFKLQILITSGVKSAHYRPIDPHVYVLYQTRLHTRSNQFGTFSVGSQQFFKSAHSNAMYKLHGDKCAECAISSSKTRPNLITWTYDDRNSKAVDVLQDRADCTHTVATPPGYSITIERSRMILCRRVVGNFICTPDPYSIVICRRVHKTDIYSSES